MPSHASHRSHALALRCLLAISLGPAIALGLQTSSRAGEAEALGLQVPPGFEVSLYADDALAHDIYSMTVDARGRVVVAGQGYVKILHDDDRDGRADRATLFSSLPATGAHGMVFDGPDLICTGDNSVMRQRDSDGDGVADGDPEVWTQLGHSEHGANGVARGPDGCYYIACGNGAGVSVDQITTNRSPVAQPRSGAVVRFAPDGQPLDVFAHGFRNVYDLDFNSDGRLFTVDSDGERDHHLPWYAPSRLFDVGQGLEHGWLLMDRTRGWNRPPSFFDSVERLVEFGRGSPTGLVVYRHRAFGPRYRGGVFTACWSLGRVYYCPLTPSGATVRTQAETFLQTTGDVGFAPSDLAIGPAGELFVAIGGRRTRGSVFCVRATGSTTIGAARIDPPDVAGILSADQPLASWSRARWLPAAEKLGAATFQQAAEDSSRSIAQRLRALEIVVELNPEVDHDWTQRMATSRHAPLRARTAWLLSRSHDVPAGQQILARLTGDDDPAVQRAAWEALLTANQFDPQLPVQPDWSTGLTSPERRVRAASILVAKRTGQASYQKYLAGADAIANEPSDDRWRRQLADLWIRTPDAGTHEQPPFTADDLQTCVACFRAAGKDVKLALEAVRLLQVALGDLHTPTEEAEVYTGYAGRLTEKLDLDVRTSLGARLAPAFPTGDAELDRELARLLGMLPADSDGLLPAISAKWTDASTVENDIHYLIVASRLPGDRGAEVTRATATALLKLHSKLNLREQFASRNWPFRVGEAFDALCRRDPALPEALLACSEFGHAHHTLFVRRLPEALRPGAIRKLWTTQVATDAAPTSDMIALAGELPEQEARTMIVSQWDEAGLRDPIVLALARHPRQQDRAKFVEALASAQETVVQRAAGALVGLGINCSTAEMAAALRALKRACGASAKQTEPRRSLVRLLNFWTEENSGVDVDPDPARAWVGWYQMFEDYYPAAAAELNRSSRTDAAGWKKRLTGVDWDRGDVARGRVVFEGRACHRCHEQNGHLGPALAGVTGRLSRDDLFAAIVDPNLEVSPTYQTTVIVTNAGQVYHGLIVYESPEITLLQTGPDNTMRITNTDRSSVRRGTQSIMPTELLDPLSDQDLGDLYAYLRTLVAK